MSELYVAKAASPKVRSKKQLQHLALNMRDASEAELLDAYEEMMYEESYDQRAARKQSRSRRRDISDFY
jgi:hypothetical protein